MTDTKIIEETVRLVGEGVSVTLPVEGNSMLPFIIGGRESVILQKPFDKFRDRTVGESVEPQVGDVVLAWVQGGYYVVHRIIAIEGDTVTLMGDGNLVRTEQCHLDDVKARVTHVVDAKGRTHYLYKGWRKLAAKVWFWLRPVRRYLLAIYRRL